MQTQRPRAAPRVAGSPSVALLKSLDDQLAQCSERIARCERLVAEASADPDKPNSLQALTTLLDSERTHQQTLTQMRARQQDRVDRLAGQKVLGRILLGVVVVLEIAWVFLRHRGGH